MCSASLLRVCGWLCKSSLVLFVSGDMLAYGDGYIFGVIVVPKPYATSCSGLYVSFEGAVKVIWCRGD